MADTKIKDLTHKTPSARTDELPINDVAGGNADKYITVADLLGAILAGDIPLTSAYIIVGNGSNVGAGVALSGDATISNAGVISIGNNKITSAMIALGAYGGRETFAYALTDETSLPTTGVKYTTEPWPANFTITDIIIGVTTAGTGATLFAVDILEETSVNSNSFSTIFSTKPTLDASEFTSTTAATPMVLSTSTILKGERLQLKIDTLDSNSLARGVKVVIIGYFTA